VKLGKPHAKDCVMSKIPSSIDVEKAKKVPALLSAIRQPYGLDAYVNKHETKPNKNKESIAENVRLAIASEAVFEDEALGMLGG
jgi:hypothetical protein